MLTNDHPFVLVSSAPRVHGLDTLRALAIVLVFMYHYMVFVSHEATFGWLSTVGWVGVDLFFVLSGYLIADPLLRGMRQRRQLSLPAFYARRALRTWPVFWVVLAAYFLFPGVLGGKAPPPLWTFLTFTQNWLLQPGTAFSHAWSLCIEEQFYLVLPLVLVFAAWLQTRLTLRPLHGWLLIAALMVIGIGSRAGLWMLFGREADGQLDGYYPHVYYATLCRFDEFLPGVALALLRHAHPSAWHRITAHHRAVFGAALVATAAVLWGVFGFYYIDGDGYGFVMTAFGYSLVASAFGLLVLAALCPGSWLGRTRVPGALPLALWSYSIYLSHKAVAYLLQGSLAQVDVPAGALPVLVGGTSVAVGALLYAAVEQPFMRLRARRFPNNFEAMDPARPAGPRPVG